MSMARYSDWSCPFDCSSACRIQTMYQTESKGSYIHDLEGVACSSLANLNEAQKDAPNKAYIPVVRQTIAQTSSSEHLTEGSVRVTLSSSIFISPPKF